LHDNLIEELDEGAFRGLENLGLMKNLIIFRLD
jgi:hypothetical protein